VQNDAPSSNYFNYDPSTAKCSFFIQKSGQRTFLFKGVARAVSATNAKLVFDLEGYLDQGDFDAYGNVLLRTSRSAQKFTMTLIRPYLLSYQECKDILEKRGENGEAFLKWHKKYASLQGIAKSEAEKSDEYWYGMEDHWFLSPLGFARVGSGEGEGY
jgi:hypothetical protein